MLDWSHKAHDLLASAAAASGIAVLLADVDAILKLIIGLLTAIFLLLGIIARGMDLRAKARGERAKIEE